MCRGFYCLAREPGIWRMACQKYVKATCVLRQTAANTRAVVSQLLYSAFRLWSNCIQTGTYNNSWRQMYIHRPHLYFHGKVDTHTAMHCLLYSLHINCPSAYNLYTELIIFFSSKALASSHGSFVLCRCLHQ